jgi:DNA-binding CsgD family transcriptional regulator
MTPMPEPLRGAELRAALAAICARTLTELPPVTEYRLLARQTPAMATRANGAKSRARMVENCSDHVRHSRAGKREARRRRTIAQGEQMLAMWNEGRTLAEISARFARAERTVWNTLAASGVRLGLGQGKSPLTRDEFAVQLAKLGLNGVAKALGQRVDSVRRRARRMELMP